MKRIIAAAAMLAALAGPAAPAALAAALIGKEAPAFTLPDAAGTKRSLADYAGKTVVLEWTNPECPYVRKHYDSGSMQKLQAEAVNEGVVWLTINSAAPGKEGYADGPETMAVMARQHSAETARLLDPDGAVGRLYGATATPHMFIVGGDGKLVYKGAIDDAPSTDPDTLKGAKNYVRAALNALAAGKPVDPAATQPYGCAVKYAD